MVVGVWGREEDGLRAGSSEEWVWSGVECAGWRCVYFYEDVWIGDDLVDR